MNKMKETVLSYEKLKKKIQGKPAEEKKVLAHLKEIASELNTQAVERVRVLLEASLIKLYDGINFEIPEGMDLLQLVRDNNVIFVLNHQSHADYLIFNYVLFTRYHFSNFIAGGINLNIFPIGKIFRTTGCFFIRRSFQNDILYKLTLEAYLSHLLLNENNPIEFFFEGGRSRTGKLMPPKFGLFQMLLDTHSNLVKNKPLLFVPVSIVHEHVPEQKALTQELRGSKKVQENIFQLLKLVKFLSRRFGTVHIKLGKPIEKKGPFEDLKKTTQELAFECFRSVGKGMVVTPSSILALNLLDDPSGAISFEDIMLRSRPILDYCEKFQIPLPPSLQRDRWEDSLKKALELFIESKKIKKVERKKLEKSFYVIEDNCRIEILYFKNTILHHFLVPFFINSALHNILNGNIKTSYELKNFLLEKRKQLKYEFYLPTLKELFYLGLEILSDCIGRKVDSLQEVFTVTPQELYQIALKVGPFASAFRYIYEGHYIAAMALKHVKTDLFTREEFHKISKEVFEMEILHGRFIRYSESYTLPLMKSSFSYFLNQKLILKKGTKFQVNNPERVDEMILQYARDLTDLLLSNLKVPTPLLPENQP